MKGLKPVQTGTTGESHPRYLADQGAKKSILIGFKVSAAEKELLLERAGDAGLTKISEYIRRELKL